METDEILAWHYIWKCLYWWPLSECQISCSILKGTIHLKFRAKPPDYYEKVGKNLVFFILYFKFFEVMTDVSRDSNVSDCILLIYNHWRQAWW